MRKEGERWERGREAVGGGLVWRVGVYLWRGSLVLV